MLKKVPKSEGVTDADAEREDAVRPNLPVAEHQAGTKVNGELERNVEGVLETEITDNAGIDDVAVLLAIVPNRDSGSGATVETPLAFRCPLGLGDHYVVDSVDVEILSVIAVQTQFEFEEVD